MIIGCKDLQTKFCLRFNRFKLSHRWGHEHARSRHLHRLSTWRRLIEPSPGRRSAYPIKLPDQPTHPNRHVHTDRGPAWDDCIRLVRKLPPPVFNSSLAVTLLTASISLCRQFGGFAGESEFRAEASRLTCTLGDSAPFQRKQYLCCSYDPPIKPYGRRNEVWFLQDEPWETPTSSQLYFTVIYTIVLQMVSKW